MQANDTSAETSGAASRTGQGRGSFMDTLLKAANFVAEVLARFWPISRTPDEILAKARRR